MSQQNISVLTLTVTASGTVTTARGVGYDGAQATTAGQKVMGIAMTGAAAGESLAVVTKGTAIVESGAAIAIGDSLMVDTQGRVTPVTGNLSIGSGATPVTSTAANGEILTGADLPEYLVGDALQAASAAGKFIEILLR
ncbi:MAG: DUF2190 family protein [Magnetococcales bacterium]|nr:DUF2190 family protein [Magnetococcales bacterium]